jgi:hypothetical protein
MGNLEKGRKKQLLIRVIEEIVKLVLLSLEEYEKDEANRFKR